MLMLPPPRSKDLKTMKANKTRKKPRACVTNYEFAVTSITYIVDVIYVYEMV